MTSFDAAAGRNDPDRLIHGQVSAAPPAHAGARRTRTGIEAHCHRFGFWIFLLSDIIMFSAFFATYAVLVGNTAGGPSGRELFNLPNVALETAFLLVSSFTCRPRKHRCPGA